MENLKTFESFFDLFKNKEKESKKNSISLAIQEATDFYYKRILFQPAENNLPEENLKILKNRLKNTKEELPEIGKLLPELFDINGAAFIYDKESPGINLIIPSEWIFMRDRYGYLDEEKAKNSLIDKIKNI